MFFKKYLNSLNYELLLSNYDNDYLSSLDEQRFMIIFDYLKEKGFYYIEDIIVKYLELFELDVNDVIYAVERIQKVIGINYIEMIGIEMSLFSKIYELALTHGEN